MAKKGRSERKIKEMVEDDIASLPPSTTRAGKAYLLPDVTKDVTKESWVKQLWAPRKTKENTAQLSTNTNAAQAVVNAAAEEAAAGVTHELHAAAKKAAASAAAPERAAAEQAAMKAIKQAAMDAAARVAFAHAAPESVIALRAVIDAIKRAAINADAEAAATVDNLRGEITRLQLLLATEQAAAADARAATIEAVATINRLEEESKRTLRQLAAEQAATAVKVYVPGYNNPMTNKTFLTSGKGRELTLRACLLVQKTDGLFRLKESSSSQNNKAESTLRV